MGLVGMHLFWLRFPTHYRFGRVLSVDAMCCYSPHPERNLSDKVFTKAVRDPVVNFLAAVAKIYASFGVS